MSWQMHAIATYGRLIRRPRTYATPQSARAYLKRPKKCQRTTLATGQVRSLPADPRHYQRVRLLHSAIQQRRDHCCWPVVGCLRPRRCLRQPNRARALETRLRDRRRHPAPCTRALYGLAPQHCAEEAIDLLGKVMDRAAQSGPIYIAGDSSGAGLALAATQTVIIAGATPPLGLTLISPWLDIALTNPAIATIANRDPWLAVPGLRECGRVWARHLPADDNRVSPIHGELHNLPPIDLYVGDRDIFVADCRQLRDSIGSDRITYHEQIRSNSRLPTATSP